MRDDLVRRHWPTIATFTVLAARYAADSLRHRREQRKGYVLNSEDLQAGSEQFLHAAEALTSAPISRGNELELLINGDAIFPAFLETIRNARRTLDLLSFAYWRGDIAHEVAAALAERARAGVTVNVLVDAFGSAKMDPRLITDMREAGVRVIRFRPVKPYAIGRMNNRNHRKLLIADGKVGMIGGAGIAKEWTGNAHDSEHWRDTHLRVHGPIVRGLQGGFAESWLEATGEVLVGTDYLPDLEAVDGAGPMQLVRSRAGVGDTNVEALYFLAIACAREHIELTAAYFAPRPAFVDALVEAARRGVRVRILVPGKYIDKELVRRAGHAVYDRLLAAGIRIWEYGPTMLHAKVMTVDGCWSSVGSVNFDNRSFQLHDEATLSVQSTEFAEALIAQFERDLESSEETRKDAWRERPLRSRALERAMTYVRREL